MNTTVVHFKWHWVLVAVISPRWRKSTPVCRIKVDTAHERWSVECHVHVQTPTHCTSVKQWLKGQELLREFTRFTRWMQNSARRPPTFGPSRQTWAVGPPVGSTIHHRITQSKSWYTFYHPAESRRLSRPRWLVTRPDGLPLLFRVYQQKFLKPLCQYFPQSSIFESVKRKWNFYFFAF